MATSPNFDPTSRTVRIKLNNGRSHTLFFDMNTFFQFEEKAGKTLPAFLVELGQAFSPLIKKAQESEAKNKGQESEEKIQLLTEDPMEIAQAMSKLSVKDVRALIWAALHDYDNEGEPKWPYTIGKLGGLIDHTNLANIMGSLMDGVSGSLPRPDKDKPKEVGKDKVRPIQSPETDESTGSGSGDLDKDILDSMETR